VVPYVSDPVSESESAEGTPPPAGGRWYSEATTCWAGNRVSFATGTSDEHEALQLRAEGWALWHWDDVGDRQRTCRQVDEGVARTWLLQNEHDEVADLIAVPQKEVGTEVTCGRTRPMLARVYVRGADDGTRILVDRLWPRGISRDSGLVDLWWKQLAPSTPLRRWYGHEPGRREEFRQKYIAELCQPAAVELLEKLARLFKAGPLTLVTATRDLSGSGAAVLVGLVADRAHGPD